MTIPSLDPAPGALARREIGTQPECWRAGAGLGSSVAALVPPDRRIAVVGCGTSWFVASAYARLREGRGAGETDVFPASQLPETRSYDLVVAISRSGTTTEVLRVLSAAGAPTLLVTAVAGSPAARRADAVVDLGFADERSVVQTRFATTALATLRASLGESVATAARDAERALALDVDDLLGDEQYTFLGDDWTVGLADEAALKLREAALTWSESYPAMEYRHGPISIAQQGRTVWMFGDPPPGLAAEVTATGARFVHHAGLDPMASLVVAQRVAVARGLSRGLDPDRPRHLTRSVVLDEH
ncbi:SIS domain-containing protein [Jiangella rhizosphaerae]|uniref:SIS domain-containing protein n=1 Tax=Jiangella rhizosphaerae TaxID=2293569 RepID=A0A418KG19_9ACTN|nr:SIS domain-containing protein [Jiangella rhizosphaerae]RIQ10826.1 SIS domain-containing protein [Jiangella rhizosphaerae]